MFKLRVSNTLLSLSIASALFGPGILVRTLGPVGSSGKNGCSEPLSGTAPAEAAACCLRIAKGVVFAAGRAIGRERKGRARPAVRRREAMEGGCGPRMMSGTAYRRHRGNRKDEWPATTTVMGQLQSEACFWVQLSGRLGREALSSGKLWMLCHCEGRELSLFVDTVEKLGRGPKPTPCPNQAGPRETKCLDVQKLRQAVTFYDCEDLYTP